MADPAACIDLASRLRGLGTKNTKFGTVIDPAPSTPCAEPPLVSQLAHHPVGIPKPRAGRDPHGIVSGRIVAETAWAPAVIDDRSFQTIIGKTSRMDGRAEFIVPGR
jgi:hypothetical protein